MRSYRLTTLLPLIGCFIHAACNRGTRSYESANPARKDAIVEVLAPMARTGRGIPGPPATGPERFQLDRLYRSSANTPLWLSPSGNLRPVGKDALERLLDAGSEGLRPEDYAAARLDSLARQVAAEHAANPDPVARLDAGLSLGMLRYLRHLHAGRVNPRSIGLAMDPPSEHHDYANLLVTALREGNLDEVSHELAPPLAEYSLVRSALAQYRKRPTDSLAPQPLQLRIPLKPGTAAPGLDALARRLVETGDLPAQRDTAAPLRYEDALAGAVSRFQARHGLKADSVLGKDTLDELNVPLTWRTHQLELALERLRWLHDLGDEPFLLVNIPMFELTAWTSPLVAGPAFRTGVIVGQALDKQTPVLIEEMRYVIFQPYWNIPPSIARDETIPAIEKNADYLRKNNLEIVRGQGDDAGTVALSDDALEGVARGEFRIRQRPGRGNALGPIKFVFPNDQNVYLHGTPAEELFDRSRRDFSHGCVRVEDPTGLAEWVLSDQPEWTRDHIVEAMNDSSRISRRVSLLRPLTVVLFYTTAEVESDGTVRFARDIYGHDRRLDAALHQGPE
jgi:murein L,D-transpeptidase YcbB/YkuD